MWKGANISGTRPVLTHLLKVSKIHLYVASNQPLFLSQGSRSKAGAVSAVLMELFLRMFWAGTNSALTSQG